MEGAKFEFKIQSDHPMIKHLMQDLLTGAKEQAALALESWLGRRFPKEAYAVLRKRTDASRAGDLKQVERYENDFFVLTGLTWLDLGKEIKEQEEKIRDMIQKSLEKQIREIEEEAPEDNASDASSEGVSS